MFTDKLLHSFLFRLAKLVSIVISLLLFKLKDVMKTWYQDLTQLQAFISVKVREKVISNSWSQVWTSKIDPHTVFYS